MALEMMLQELRKEWESFSVMLVDHYGGAKTREVLRDLASDKLQAVYPQLACIACLGLSIPLSTPDCEHVNKWSTIRIEGSCRNAFSINT